MSKPRIFTRKPSQVEAVIWEGTPESHRSVSYWLASKDGELGELQVFHDAHFGDVYFTVLETLKGKVIVNKGDWIVLSVKDGFYPLKPDVFEQTYEEFKKDDDELYI